MCVGVGDEVYVCVCGVGECVVYGEGGDVCVECGGVCCVCGVWCVCRGRVLAWVSTANPSREDAKILYLLSGPMMLETAEPAPPKPGPSQDTASHSQPEEEGGREA